MPGQIQTTIVTVECLKFLHALKGRALSSGDAIEEYITRCLGEFEEEDTHHQPRLHRREQDYQHEPTMCERAMVLSFHLMLLSQYATEDTPNIQRRVISKHLLDLLANNPKGPKYLYGRM